MTITITSREFNRDVSAAKRAADNGPVVITDHGRRSHVLITAELFDELTVGRRRMGDRIWRNQDPAIELALPDRELFEQRDIGL